jgi:hypothetical protein
MSSPDALPLPCKKRLRFSPEVAEAVEAVEAEAKAVEAAIGGKEAPPKISPDEPTSVFDLSPRLDRLPNMTWALHSRKLAEELRVPTKRCLSWYSAQAMTAWPLPVQVSRAHGVHSFDVDVRIAQAVFDYLEDPVNYDADGFLNIGGTQFPGYGGYPYVHAKQGVVSLFQQTRTVRVHSKHWVRYVLTNFPAMQDLVTEVRCRQQTQPFHLPHTMLAAALSCLLACAFDNLSVQIRLKLGFPTEVAGGKCLRSFHFLCQDKSQQASFSWHSDKEDLAKVGVTEQHLVEMITVVVQLSPGPEISGVRMWGFQPFLFEGQGSACTFPGDALHESLPRLEQFPAQQHVRKVALFFA